MTEPRWRKASYSGNQANCVELASTMDQLRDSKNPEHTLPTPALRHVLHAVKNGHFDR
jgi:hypothetical protein